MEGDLIVVIVVATALAFDFTNGFHDTANVVATSISTRAMAPRIAVGYAADPQLRRRVHVAGGGGHDRERRSQSGGGRACSPCSAGSSVRSPGT